STVALNWRAASIGSDAVTFVVEVGSSSKMADLAQQSTDSPALVAPNVPAGKYYIRVRAANRSGTSEPSNELVVVVGHSESRCITVPAAPTALVSFVSGGTVTLVWNASGDAVSYVLEAA